MSLYQQLLHSKTTVVWLGLIIATIVSWQVGTHGGSAEVSTSIVVAIAFLKVRFVGLWFMELKDAPLPLRFIFEGYVVIVGLAVIIMYLAM
jgi:caa(3)-type oxidase subunit IV